MPVAPETTPETAQPVPRGATWPWAIGSVLAVLLVLTAAVVGRQVVAQTRQAALVVGAPRIAPPPVVAVAGTQAPIALLGLDAPAGHLVALTAPRQAVCPPIGACPAAPALDAFVVLDDATAQPLARTPLGSGAASESVLLLTDASRHLAYAVAPHAVTVFSTQTGERSGSYDLPADAGWARESGGAVDAQRNLLVLVGQGQLLTLDATSGRVLARRSLVTGATSADGPVLDASGGTAFLVERAGGATALVAYDAATLRPLWQRPLPSGTRLGPLDPTRNALHLVAPDGTVSRLALGGPQPQSAPLEQVPAAKGAQALGWDAVTGHLFVGDSAAFTTREATSGQPQSALPVRVAWPLSSAVLVDSGLGLVYLPTTGGEVLIAREAGDGRPLTAAAATALARSAMARFLPDTNQTPPFVAPETFPLGQGTRAHDYWIHFSDLGWKGPYPGTSGTSVAATAGQPGAYRVTFSIAWHQLFDHSHTWTCSVTRDGTVRLVAESGDAVP